MVPCILKWHYNGQTYESIKDDPTAGINIFVVDEVIINSMALGSDWSLMSKKVLDRDKNTLHSKILPDSSIVPAPTTWCIIQAATSLR